MVNFLYGDCESVQSVQKFPNTFIRISKLIANLPGRFMQHFDKYKTLTFLFLQVFQCVYVFPLFFNRSLAIIYQSVCKNVKRNSHYLAARFLYQIRLFAGYFSMHFLLR